MDVYDLMRNYLRTNPNFIGMGAPTRSASYILGYTPRYKEEDKYRRKKY